MKFLCLGYIDMRSFDKLSETQKYEILNKCFAQCEVFRATGKVVEEEGLHHIDQAKTIRSRGGKQTVTDGPFMETKEQVGAFFVVEAESMEEAIKVAALHPGAMYGEEYGFGIEVRPITSSQEELMS